MVMEGNYDILHFDMINMAPYLDDLVNTDNCPAVVLSTNDAISLRYQRFAEVSKGFRKKAKFVILSRYFRRMEIAYFSKFQAVHVVSKVDAAYLARFGNIEVIPICVDDSIVENSLEKRVIGNVERNRVLLFTSGNLANAVNSSMLSHFIEEVFPQVNSPYHEKDIRMEIYGKGISQELHESLANKPRINYQAWVDDYAGRLKEANICIFFDMIGSGMKNRVLQAMAYGKPVIATPGALEGIEIADGKNALIGHTAQEMAQSTFRLIECENLRERLGAAAADLIREKYSQSETGKQWEALYAGAIERAATRKT